MRLAVLGAEPVPRTVAAAAAWFAAVSAGCTTITPTAVAAAPPDDGWDRYAGRGGRGPAPDNSQTLVADLLASVPAEDRRLLGEVVVVSTPAAAGFAAHTWRLRGGGVHLGGRRWVRRYAVVPADAPLGTVAHELGHLVLGWPDLERRIGGSCLMALGGHRDGGRNPAPPCAALRVAAGWVQPVPATPALRLADLPPGTVVSWGDVLVERNADALLAFSVDPVRLAARILLSQVDGDRPLLAVVAERVRSPARSLVERFPTQPDRSSASATPAG